MVDALSGTKYEVMMGKIFSVDNKHKSAYIFRKEDQTYECLCVGIELSQYCRCIEYLYENRAMLSGYVTLNRPMGQEQETGFFRFILRIMHI